MSPDEYREKDFPVHHEMGDDGQVLELGDIGADIKDGECILIEVKRDEDGALRIGTVCMQGEPMEDEPRDLDEALTRTAKQAELEEMDDEDDDGEDEE